MDIKGDAVSFLKGNQRQLMKEYAGLEDIQGEYPKLYDLCQWEMDRVDRTAEFIRRKISELEESE